MFDGGAGQCQVITRRACCGRRWRRWTRGTRGAVGGGAGPAEAGLCPAPGRPELDAFEEGLSSAELWALERGYDLTSHLSDEDLRGDLDGTLPTQEAKSVRAHLATCAACRAESEDIVETRQAVQRAEARRDAAKRERYEKRRPVYALSAAATAVLILFLCYSFSIKRPIHEDPNWVVHTGTGPHSTPPHPTLSALLAALPLDLKQTMQTDTLWSTSISSQLASSQYRLGPNILENVLLRSGRKSRWERWY